jgi:hypothetical protein
MKYNAKSIDDLLSKMPEKKRTIVKNIQKQLQANLPDGFEEILMYDMITYTVPLSMYPKGYLNKEDTPLPFISLTAQKNHIALYHSGIYMDDALLDWFKTAYKSHTKKSLNMGKSCIRFKPNDDIPYSLIGELAAKVSPDEFITLYEHMR